MIIERTILKVSDNSGAKKAICIRILGGSKKKFAKIGDIIKVSIKEISSNSKVKKGDVFKAIVIRTKKILSRSDGSYIKFDNNSCILINNENNQPIGTRIFGPVTYELRNEKFLKIISLSQEVI